MKITVNTKDKTIELHEDTTFADLLDFFQHSNLTIREFTIKGVREKIVEKIIEKTVKDDFLKKLRDIQPPLHPMVPIFPCGPDKFPPEPYLTFQIN